MPFTNPDTVHRATSGATAPFTWGDTVNDDLNYLYGDAGWTAVSGYTNSWAASATTPGYILLGRVVYLRGAMTAGTANTVAFTLPAAYRPTQGGVWATTTGSGVVNYVTIQTSGTVTPLNSAVCYLTNISFPVV